MQKWTLKILCSYALLFACTSLLTAQTPARQMAMADSLFNARQYTQSLEKYQLVFDGGNYSPAMLLRMSKIEEALGNVGKSLYYLDLAWAATHDDAILAKMEEIATRHGLDGYQYSSSDRLLGWIDQHRQELQLGFAVAALGLFLIMLWVRFRKNERPVAWFVGFAMTLILLALLVNYPVNRERGILAAEPIYIMSGPSSGANVVAILGPGHRLFVEGHTDVWVKVRWNEKQGFVKQSQLLPVVL